jgi:predicted aminopeptidase
MVRLSAGLFFLVFLTSCVGPAYYFQSITGHFDLLNRRKTITELLEDRTVSAPLKKQLEKSADLRKFAEKSLLLPTAGTFTKYADLERPFATWVVFASPAYSLQPKSWCFPVTGCLAYLGFFQREKAYAMGKQLQEQGYDVYISGSPAYSTLGWFDDPLLNTFIHWPEGRLAALMFHEMAHQKLYIAGDSAFNESYAEAVSHIGVRLWFKRQGELQRLAAYDRSILNKSYFLHAVQEVRDRLAKLYLSPLDQGEMARQKQIVLLQAAREYGPDLAGGWFVKGLNNAKLASVNIYSNLVPNFIRIYKREGEDMEQFHLVMDRLSRQAKPDRMAVLQGAVNSE